MIDFEQVNQYTKNLKLLYVEDDKLLREANTNVFERFFKQCTYAVDGVDALIKYQDEYLESDEYFDLIITDLSMPRMDGHELVTKVLEKNSAQSIIVVSAHNDSDKLLALIAEGITNFIVKPVSPQLLLQILYKSCKSIVDAKMAIQYQEHLQELVSTQVESLRKQDMILQQQSKLASMGEMLDAVAHQWLQPINTISSNVELLKMNISDGEFSNEQLEDFFLLFDDQVEHLQDTLREFRSFIRPNEIIKYKSIADIIDTVLLLSKDELISQQIEVHLDIQDNSKIKIASNGLKHVIINLLSNAKDAFIEKNIIKKEISISTRVDESNLLLCVEDNAGGIDEKIIEHIFEVNFTTKDEGKGTGIGLYMTSIIIEKLNAKIKVENHNNGVKFTIKIPI